MIRPYARADLDTIGNRAWRGIYTMFRQTYGDALFAAVIPNEKTSKGEQIHAHCQHHPKWAFICEEAGHIMLWERANEFLDKDLK